MEDETGAVYAGAAEEPSSGVWCILNLYMTSLEVYATMSARTTLCLDEEMNRIVCLDEDSKSKHDATGSGSLAG